jgi:DNA-binding MarR family transcriptional regulator
VSLISETPMAVANPPAAAVEGLCPAELAAWRGLLRVHASVLKALDAAPDHRMRMCDLADSVLLSRSGMSRLVDRLERDGLLVRCACAHDARGAFACITEAGRQLLEQARPTHVAGIRRRFLTQFEEDELHLLGSFWDRLVPQQAA